MDSAFTDIAPSTLNANDYVLTATQVGADDCGNFTINHLGQRTVLIGGASCAPGMPQYQQYWDR